MKPARTVLFSVLAATAVIASFGRAGAQDPGPLADPKSENQTGFPATLYSWVIPPDNQQTPAKIALEAYILAQHKGVPLDYGKH